MTNLSIRRAPSTCAPLVVLVVVGIAAAAGLLTPSVSGISGKLDAAGVPLRPGGELEVSMVRSKPEGRNLIAVVLQIQVMALDLSSA